MISAETDRGRDRIRASRVIRQNNLFMVFTSEIEDRR
jgi:hypothetical protein